MAETLVEIVRQIEESPTYATRKDKDRAIMSAFEERARTNSAVHARFNDVSFSQKYDEVLAKYFPLDPNSLPEDIKREVDDLDECIAERFNMENSTANNTLRRMNFQVVKNSFKATAGLGFGVGSLLLGYAEAVNGRRYIAEGGEISRRSFLLRTAGSGILGGLAMGLFFDMTTAILIGDRARTLVGNVKYLDEVYQRVFNPAAAVSRETSPLVSNYFKRFGIAYRA